MEAAKPASARIRDWLKECAAASDHPDWFAQATTRLLAGFDITILGSDSGASEAGYYVLTERHPATRKPVVDVALIDGSDESGSMTGTAIPLARHVEGVAQRARQTARRLGFADELARDLHLAGLLHESAKWTEGFRLSWLAVTRWHLRC